MRYAFLPHNERTGMLMPSIFRAPRRALLLLVAALLTTAPLSVSAQGRPPTVTVFAAASL